MLVSLGVSYDNRIQLATVSFISIFDTLRDHISQVSFNQLQLLDPQAFFGLIGMWVAVRFEVWWFVGSLPNAFFNEVNDVQLSVQVYILYVYIYIYIRTHHI